MSNQRIQPESGSSDDHTRQVINIYDYLGVLNGCMDWFTIMAVREEEEEEEHENGLGQYD